MNHGIILEQKSQEFKKDLDKIKSEINPSFPWYPYGSLNNFTHLKVIFNEYPLEKLINQSLEILDIGAADGDLGFFLENLGYKVDIIDFPPTNFNHLQGIKLIKEKLNSNINILEHDLDSQFPLFKKNYELVFLLGTLYHLKNPYNMLEKLSTLTKNLIVSTRVAAHTPDGSKINKYPIAYLLAPDESNNDPTNYWIFSHKGLERIFERTGWVIAKIVFTGDTWRSNPADNDHDERAFVLLKSVNFRL